ncbi:substrate-binding domain-containing protein [Paenarthrobacter nicotinovorans]|uniref:substrate-binding domain-containing protein n=1 Tax=Paenarthrobacter nicotinovorans TaxID=29320 RepID=UPI003814D9E8
MKLAAVASTLGVALLASGCGGSLGASNSGGGNGGGSGPVRIAMVPKFTALPYFQAVEKGAKEAGAELGAQVTYQGPVNIDVAEQSNIIQQFAGQKYDAITVSATDASAVSPALAAAQKAGIKTSTWDADADPASRGVFLNQATFDGIGQALVDITVEQAGPRGKVLIVTSELTQPNQNKWIESIKKYMASKYPEMQVDAVLPTEEDPGKTRQVTMDYLRGHPGTVGVISVAGGSTPGVAEALKQLNLVGKVSGTGISVPSIIRSYLQEGSLKKVVLWNPVDLGYAAIHLAYAQVKGTLDESSGTFDAGRLGKLKFVGPGEILLGDPLIFTKDNVNQFDF